MATGISKNHWNNDEKIIKNNEIMDIGNDFELTYYGKGKVDDILAKKNESRYTKVIPTNNHFDSSIFWRDNLDVIRYLFHSKEMKGTIKLIYIDPPYGTNNIFHCKKTYSHTKIL